MKPSIFTPILFLSAVAARTWGFQKLPTVIIRNGTIIGASDLPRNVESFLGIPYAQPPIWDLRFNLPQLVASSWKTPLDASSYVPHWLGSSLALEGLEQESIEHTKNEDCLTINIAHPANIPENASLPVLVWIHGGRFVDGGCSDPR